MSKLREALSVGRPLRSSYHIPRTESTLDSAPIQELLVSRGEHLDDLIAKEMKRLHLLIKNTDIHIEREVNDVKRQLSIIEARIVRMENVIDDVEQKNNLKCLIFHNVLEKRSERLAEVMLWLLQNKGKCDVKREDIIECYRLGNKPHFGEASDWRHRRPVVVRFKSHRVRQQVWSHFKDLRKESLFVYEFLTPRRQELLEATRQAFGAKNVWTQDGNIFYWPSKGPKQMVTDLQHLGELLGNNE